MDTGRIALFLKDRIQLANPESNVVVPERIALPNEVFDPADFDIWFEIAVVPGTQSAYTEFDDLAACAATVAVCVPENTGFARAHNIAGRIRSLFSAQDPARGRFRIGAGEAIVRESGITPGILDSHVYKVAAKILMEIYEPAAPPPPPPPFPPPPRPSPNPQGGGNGRNPEGPP